MMANTDTPSRGDHRRVARVLCSPDDGFDASGLEHRRDGLEDAEALTEARVGVPEMCLAATDVQRLCSC